MLQTMRDFCKNTWTEVYNRIIGAVVFIDDASAECLHWDGGYFSLIDNGALEVKALSPFECSNTSRKAVFISQATQTQLKTIREIIHNSDFTHCLLISSVSLDIIYLELNDGRDVSDVVVAGKAADEGCKQLEEMLLEWIGKKISAAEAIHIPIFCIAPTNNIFVTPPYHRVFPTFSGNLTPNTSTVDLYTLPGDERAQIRRLASSLNSFFELNDIKDEVYHMGTYSSLVAGVLDNSPVCLARRKLCSTPASLLLVDRTLDLAAVTSHAGAPLDRVCAALPRRAGHATDVAVDVSPLCAATVISVVDDVQLSPGCLAHDDAASRRRLGHMFTGTQKEVLREIYEDLTNIEISKSPGHKAAQKVTPQSIDKIVNSCKGNYDVIERHLGLLQQALAVSAAARAGGGELLAGVERQAALSLAASRASTSVLTQISSLIKSRKDRNIELIWILALLVHIYSLAGTEITFSKQQEDQLKETLSVAIHEDYASLYPASEGAAPTAETCQQLANSIMNRLNNIAQMRKSLTKYSSVLPAGDGGGAGAGAGAGGEYRGVLEQLMADVTDPRRPPLPDLRHRGDGIKDLLRSGLNILGKRSARRHPMDGGRLIVLVVGGASAAECARAAQLAGAGAGVLVGATRLLSPAEAAREALGLV